MLRMTSENELTIPALAREVFVWIILFFVFCVCVFVTSESY